MLLVLKKPSSTRPEVIAKETERAIIEFDEQYQPMVNLGEPKVMRTKGGLVHGWVRVVIS